MEGHAIATGRYELIRQIAEGGFGQVYLARMLGAAGFHRTVAIKRIRLNQAASPDQIDDFIREARIGGYLHHHNVVQVMGFEELEGAYSLIMEYVDGVGLNQIIDLAYARGLDLPISMIAELIAQAAEGLQYIHTLSTPEGQPLKLVHRDLKPSNLLFSRSGMLKITDFGIARTALGIGKGTQAGTIKGTLVYLSPEQARGELLDHRSDLYSLGAILFELLMLEPLHYHESPLVLLRQLACNQVEARLELLEGTRGAVFLPVLRRLLSSAPEDRYASASEVAQAVRTIQQLHVTPGVHLVNQAVQWIDAVGGSPSPSLSSGGQALAQATLPQPAVAQPAVAQPGVAQSGVAQPAVAQPAVAQMGGSRAAKSGGNSLPPPVAVEDGEWALDRELAEDLGEALDRLVETRAMGPAPVPAPVSAPLPAPVFAPLSTAPTRVTRPGSNALTRVLQPLKIGRLSRPPVFGMATRQRAAGRRLTRRVGAVLAGLLALGGWMADGCPVPDLLADREEVLTTEPVQSALVPGAQTQPARQLEGAATADAAKAGAAKAGVATAGAAKAGAIRTGAATADAATAPGQEAAQAAGDTDSPEATLATHVPSQARGNDLQAQDRLDVRQGLLSSKGMGPQR